jgi:hypothetical protein
VTGKRGGISGPYYRTHRERDWLGTSLGVLFIAAMLALVVGLWRWVL